MSAIGKFDVYKQFHRRCGYIFTINNEGMYNKLWTEDNSEGTSKCYEFLGSNDLDRMASVLESKSFPVFSEVLTTVW